MSWDQQEFTLFQRCTKALEEISKSLQGIEESLGIIAESVPIPWEIVPQSSGEDLDCPKD
jgi:hypothetical protein